MKRPIKKAPKLYIVKKIGSKKYLFDGTKKIGSISQKWVKVGQKFTEKDIIVEGKCVTYCPGWHELDLSNDFDIDNDWRAYRVSIKCPVCNKFTH